MTGAAPYATTPAGPDPTGPESTGPEPTAPDPAGRGPSGAGAAASAGGRADVAGLLRATLRTMPWAQLAVGGVLALALMVLARDDPGLGVATLVEYLRLGAVALAVGTAGALDDAARPHLDGVPVALWRRQALRIGITVVTVGLWWALAVTVAATHPVVVRASAQGAGLPLAALTVLLVALVATTLAVAALVTRRRGGSGVLPAAGVAVVLPGALVLWGVTRDAMLPRFAPAPGGPADAAWAWVGLRWGALALVAVGVLAWALRDPCAPGRPVAAPTSPPTAMRASRRAGARPHPRREELR